MSGGRAIASSAFTCNAGLCSADVTELMRDANVSRPAEVRAAWVGGKRVPRVRTRLLQWKRSIDPGDQKSEINRRGFVYSPSSWDDSWSLQPNATRCDSCASLRITCPASDRLFLKALLLLVSPHDQGSAHTRALFLSPPPLSLSLLR